MFALIQNTKVVQIENSIFPVSEDLSWVACDSSITTDYFYINGEFKITDKSDEDFLAEKKNEKTAQCQTYLEGTDWQAAAFIKYGRPVDANVSENCLKAKQWKIEIAACTTLEELNNININFE